MQKQKKSKLIREAPYFSGKCKKCDGKGGFASSLTSSGSQSAMGKAIGSLAKPTGMRKPKPRVV
ncbi:MAG: hypothetical protein WC455_10165 [Dehalococcoidia bacterium]|jgi:hypothetical protein